MDRCERLTERGVGGGEATYEKNTSAAQRRTTALPTGVANTRLARSSASTVRPTRPCWAGVTRRPPPTPRADARSRRRGRRARGTRAQRHRSTERPCCPMEIPVQPPAHAGGPRRVTRECTRLRRCVCAAAPTITGGRGRFVRWMGVNHSFPHRPGQRRVRGPHGTDGGGHAGRNDPAGRGGHGRPPAPEDGRNRARQVRVVPRTTGRAPVDDDSAGERGFRGGRGGVSSGGGHTSHALRDDVFCRRDNLEHTVRRATRGAPDQHS